MVRVLVLLCLTCLGAWGDVCELVAKRVVELRAGQALSAPVTIKVSGLAVECDRFLGASGPTPEQTSAVFLSRDEKYAVKLYSALAGDWQFTAREYWMSKYLAEKGIPVSGVVGKPESISARQLDATTLAFLAGRNITSQRIHAIVKEYAPGVTLKELKAMPGIDEATLATQKRKLYGLRKKVESLFENGAFNQWLRRQGPEATNFANSGDHQVEAAEKNWLLTPSGWVLADP